MKTYLLLFQKKRWDIKKIYKNSINPCEINVFYDAKTQILAIKIFQKSLLEVGALFTVYLLLHTVIPFIFKHYYFPFCQI